MHLNSFAPHLCFPTHPQLRNKTSQEQQLPLVTSLSRRKVHTSLTSGKIIRFFRLNSKLMKLAKSTFSAAMTFLRTILETFHSRHQKSQLLSHKNSLEISSQTPLMEKNYRNHQPTQYHLNGFYKILYK